MFINILQTIQNMQRHILRMKQPLSHLPKNSQHYPQSALKETSTRIYHDLSFPCCFHNSHNTSGRLFVLQTSVLYLYPISFPLPCTFKDIPDLSHVLPTSSYCVDYRIYKQVYVPRVFRILGSLTHTTILRFDCNSMVKQQ